MSFQISDQTKRYLAILILMVVFACVVTTEVKAERLIFDKHKKTIVIDPGHGGHDRGAQGPDGTLEKRVTLTLARMIKAELENKYSSVLTRAGDYWLDIPSRTAVANHLKADLFISIHTGGSFLHKASGILIFYFTEISEPVLTLEAALSKPLKDSDTQIPWYNIQDKHIATSEVLAKLMQNRINDQIKFMESKIERAPLMVLSGADMPAILIEVGYLTNPAEEKELRNVEILSEVAKGISNGIDDFFSQKNR